MTHPLALYIAQVHMADLRAEATSERTARLARQPRTNGPVASIVAGLRSLFGSTDARNAASPA